MTDFSTFRAGDRVSIAARVLTVEAGWMTVKTESGRMFREPVEAPGYELVERPDSPGRRAWEAWAQGIPGHIPWKQLDDHQRARWDRIAAAACGADHV